MNSSWIKVADSERLRKRYVYLEQCTRTLLTRAITFKASIRSKGYKQGHVWHVSEDDITKAIHQLKQEDLSFAKRISQEQMSAFDAQRIIEIASHGILKISLVE